MTVRRQYILLIECYGKRTYTRRKASPSNQNEMLLDLDLELPAGSLLEAIPDENYDYLIDKDDPESICLRSLDFKDVYLPCSRREVEELTTFETDLLLPVKPYHNRLKLYLDDGSLEAAEKLQLGSPVTVTLRDKEYRGILKYKGPVPERVVRGTLFGVELLEHKADLGCDGSIGAKKYFTCAPNCGVFVTVASIHSHVYSTLANPARLNHLHNHFSLQGITGSSGSKPKSAKHKSSSKAVEASHGLKAPLDFGDRVVWISDDGPEYGYVRWIGKLPDTGDDCMVGVEFDNPVGTGTGNYNDIALFQTEVNHASIVPIMGLMKANDFAQVSADSSLPHPVSDSKTQAARKPNRTIPSSNSTSSNNIPSAMFVPHKDHPLCHRSPNQDPTYQDNHHPGSHTPMCMSRESLPYLPHQHPSHSQSRDSGIQCFNNYATPQSSLPAYESDCTNAVPKASLYKTMPNPNRTLSTLPTYSSQSVYPRSASECTPHCYNTHRYVSDEPSTNTLTSTRSYELQSQLRNSTGCAVHKLESPINSSCPEMDSGSFYHVVPDDCTDVHQLGSRNSLPAFHLRGSNQDCRFKNMQITNDLDMFKHAETIHDDQLDEVLEIGSVVEVIIRGVPQYGLIKWIGTFSEYQNGQTKIAGIELEEENSSCTDGTFNGTRLFECPPSRGFFVPLNRCRKDQRFKESDSILERPGSAEFGSVDCPIVSGDIAPLSQPEDMRKICGKYRGIQGHHNSCYLDATLFSMFSFTPVFDCILNRPSTKNDILQYNSVQKVLKEEIVNPLRRNLYVRADRVMKLRKLLDELSSVSGLTSEEKDPEEFLNSLLSQIMKAEPFLKLSSGQESFFYQLFVEKDDTVVMPTVQQLFDQSFLASDIKLKEVPSCLLIQMPRFGKQFKMYSRIIPSPYLDITDILENSPRQCSICGKVAEFECKDCYRQFGEGLESTAFCLRCLDKSHSNIKRSKHKSSRLCIPDNFDMLKDHTSIPRIFMELFAVMCIETSHYVAFVKCGTGPDAPWCFFDSMADRRGEQNGYNIPEVVQFDDLKWWLSEEGFNSLLSTKDDKNLPEMPKRLLCDAYMCFYQSPDVMMYR